MRCGARRHRPSSIERPAETSLEQRLRSHESADANSSEERGRSSSMTKPANSRNYEIRVRGVLGETLLQAFPGLQARTEGCETVLSGELADRAALHGVLGGIGVVLARSARRAQVAPPQPPARRGFRDQT